MNFTIHSSAVVDIRMLKERDVNGISKVLSLLSELKADPELIDCLNIQGRDLEFADGGHGNVLRVQSVKRIADVWRLKCWDSDDALMPYRVIYAFFPAGQYRKVPEVFVLAVVDRSQYNYEPHHAITQRVLADCKYLV